MNKIEHIGIAVHNLDEANELFARLLNTPHYKIETIDSEGVRTSFFQIGEVKIELLEATRTDSPIAKFLEKRGAGIHHIAFDVDRIESELERLKQEGFMPLSNDPKPGADGKRIAFLHPGGTSKVLIELCEDAGSENTHGPQP